MLVLITRTTCLRIFAFLEIMYNILGIMVDCYNSLICNVIQTKKTSEWMSF